MIRPALMLSAPMAEVENAPSRRPWLTPGVGGIGTASFLADVGHEIPTSLLPSFVTATLGAPAAALGLIEGVAEGLAGTGRFVGGALADDPRRRRTVAVGGYTATAVLSSLIGATTRWWPPGHCEARPGPHAGARTGAVDATSSAPPTGRPFERSGGGA